MREADKYFDEQTEPAKSYMLFLRNFILAYDSNLAEAWKYKMAFYCYKNKMFCYLRVNKKTGFPYIGIVDGKLLDHPNLVAEGRSRMKVMEFDPLEDIPVDIINEVLDIAVTLRNKR